MEGTYGQEVIPDAEATQHQIMRNITGKADVRFAFSGVKRLLSDVSEAMDNEMKLRHDMSISVYDGTEFRQRIFKSFLIQSPKSTYADANAYIGCLRRARTEEEARLARQHPGHTDLLPYCLLSADWRLRPTHSLVDGHQCVVAERSMPHRALFFDVERHYSLLRAEYQYAVNEGPGVKRPYSAVFEYKGHRAILSDLYLPTEIVGHVAMVDEQGRPGGTLTNRIVLKEVRINQVRDDVFTLAPEVGDYVMDSIRHQTYSYVGRDEHTLDLAAGEAATTLASAGRRGLTKALITFAAAMCAGALVAHWTLPWLRSRRKRTV